MATSSAPSAERPDHRHDSEAQLLAALRERRPLALAEAYHRTIAAGHAVARRLLGRSGDVEALLAGVYLQLWSDPPTESGLEGWVRARCFERGAEVLRDAGRAPAAASLRLLLPDLPAPDARYLDLTEKALAELPETQRRALLGAHDQGVPSSAQDGEGVAAVLTRALATLAGPEPGGVANGDGCEDPRIADWVLGLLVAGEAEEVATATAAPGCESWAKTLRRGRRRIEGLPPTPDMGNRILVTILTAPAADGQGEVGAAPADNGASAVEDPADDGPSAVDADATDDEPTAVDGPAAYTALAELDDPPPPDRSGDETQVHESPATSDTAAGAETEPPSDDEEASGGSRVLTWLLGAIVIAVGVGLGVVLGLTAIPWVLDRFFT